MIPPPLPAKHSKPVIAAITVVVTVALCAIVYCYYTYNPGLSALAPKCIFHLITGWDCPGCGSQRAIHALMHGNIAEAWNYNAFIFFAVPVALFYGIVEAGRRRWPVLYARAIHPSILILILISIIAWWIGRNL